jgi:hypothetical protein
LAFYFCDLGAHAKFQNPTTTHSGFWYGARRKDKEEDKKNEKLG